MCFTSVYPFMQFYTSAPPHLSDVPFLTSEIHVCPDVVIVNVCDKLEDKVCVGDIKLKTPWISCEMQQS